MQNKLQISCIYNRKTSIFIGLNRKSRRKKNLLPEPEGFFPVDFGKNFSKPFGGSEEYSFRKDRIVFCWELVTTWKKTWKL